MSWEEIKDWEIWKGESECIEYTLVPATHCQKELLTKGAKLVKQFQAESYERAKQIYDQYLHDDETIST